MARKKHKPKELYWIADVDKNDVRCLIELSLVLKDKEMFMYYTNLLNGWK